MSWWRRRGLRFKIILGVSLILAPLGQLVPVTRAIAQGEWGSNGARAKP